MATKLTKPVVRELILNDRGRTVIVTIEPPDMITFREKGKGTRYSVSLHKVQLLGLMQYLFDKYREKKEIYLRKKSAGYKKIRRPKIPSIQMFNKFYQEIIRYQPKHIKL